MSFYDYTFGLCIPPQGEFSDIPAGDGNIEKLFFYGVTV
jgi:hypothetical protein